jgi:hypothetical protein
MILIPAVGVMEGVPVATVEGVVEVRSIDAISIVGKLTVVDGCCVSKLSIEADSVSDDAHPVTKIKLTNRKGNITCRIIC